MSQNTNNDNSSSNAEAENTPPASFTRREQALAVSESALSLSDGEESFSSLSPRPHYSHRVCSHPNNSFMNLISPSLASTSSTSRSLLYKDAIRFDGNVFTMNRGGGSPFAPSEYLTEQPYVQLNPAPRDNTESGLHLDTSSGSSILAAISVITNTIVGVAVLSVPW